MEEMDGGYKVETPSRIIGGLAADLFTPTGLFGGSTHPAVRLSPHLLPSNNEGKFKDNHS